MGQALIDHHLGNEDEDSDRDLPTRRKKIKYNFETDGDGYLILPDPDGEGDMKLAKMEQLIRAFITIYYSKPFVLLVDRVAYGPIGKAVGKQNVSVPWGSLVGSEAVYVDQEYLPEGFTFKEPSKLSKVEARDRLKFWYDRQENPRVKKVFQFRRIRGKHGEPELPVEGQKKKKPSRKRQGRPAKKTGGRKAPRDASSEPEEDNEDGGGDEDKDKDDEDDEDEDEDEDEEDDAADDDEGDEEAEMDGDEQEEDEGEEPDRDEEAEEPHLPGRKKIERRPLKAPKSLPFEAKRIVPKRRYGPATGPQFEPPATRQRKRKAMEEPEDIPKKKKGKKFEEVTRVGPPIGKKKDKLVKDGGKGKVRK
jgi:hypothetical protein